MFRGGTCLGKTDMEPCSAANGRLQPGFRFHPTNVELVMYYLKRKVLGKCLKPELITEVDVYQFHPKDLRDFSSLKKDLNWYFFCPRGKKYGSGDRTNRATRSGYWKATGVDRVVSYQDRTVGKIKTLVYHLGKPPKGTRTDWVMHEYRLEDKKLADEGVCQGSYVLCKIFEKSGWGPKNREQYGAPFVEEEWADDDDDEDYQMVVHWGNHSQSTSGVANVNACSSEQFYSGAVSVVSDLDQAPTPMPNVAAEIASSSRALAPYSDYAADQMLTPISVAGNLASSSMASLQYCTDPRGFEVANPLVFPQAAAADIPSTSTNPVPNEDYDEIDRMLDMFVADDCTDVAGDDCTDVAGDDCTDVFGNLGDLDHGTAWDWRDMEQVGGGLLLTDLDPPLDGI